MTPPSSCTSGAIIRLLWFEQNCEYPQYCCDSHIESFHLHSQECRGEESLEKSIRRTWQCLKLIAERSRWNNHKHIMQCFAVCILQGYPSSLSLKVEADIYLWANYSRSFYSHCKERPLGCIVNQACFRYYFCDMYQSNDVLEVLFLSAVYEEILTQLRLVAFDQINAIYIIFSSNWQNSLQGKMSASTLMDKKRKISSLPRFSS